MLQLPYFRYIYQVKRLLLSFFIISISCLILEITVRIIGLAPQLNYQYSNHAPDPFLPHKPRPNTTREGTSATNEFNYSYHYNSLGFRDIEHQIQKPKDVFRIVGVGDSFTMGAGVSFEQTYLYRLEELLNNRKGNHPKIEIIKLGISRFFPETERIVLEQYGKQFSPDLVLIGFLPNDILDTHHGIDAIKVDSKGRLRTRESLELGEWASFLYEYSHVLRILLIKYVSFKMNERTPIKFSDIYIPEGPLEKDWIKVESDLKKIAEVAESISAKTAIIHIPQGAPWLDEHWYPSKRLSTFSEKNNLFFIDTLPAFKNYKGKEDLHYPKDGHCTQLGYDFIAQTIYEYLTMHQLIP